MELHVGKKVLAPVRLAPPVEDRDYVEATVQKIGDKAVLVHFTDREGVEHFVRREPKDLQELPDVESATVPLERVVALRDALTAALPAEWQARRIENSPESIVVTFPDDGTAFLLWVEAVV